MRRLGMVSRAVVGKSGGRRGRTHDGIDVASNVRKYFCDRFENTWVISRVVWVKAREECWV